MGFFENDKNWQKYESILQSWVGTPYHHLWAAKNRGADCMLFILDAMQEMGIIEKYTYDYYPRDWFIHTKEDLMRPIFEKNIKDNLKKSFRMIPVPMSPRVEESGVEESKVLESGLMTHDSKTHDSPTHDSIPMRGDIIALSIVTGQPTHHAAVFMEDKKIIHSANNRGVIISTWGKYWRKRITGIYRIEGK